MPRWIYIAVGAASLLLVLLFGYYFYLRSAKSSLGPKTGPTPTPSGEIIAISNPNEYIGQVILPLGWKKVATCGKFIHINSQEQDITCKTALNDAAVTIFTDTTELSKTFLSTDRTNVQENLTIAGKKATSFDVGRYKATIVFYKEGRGLYLVVNDAKYLDVYNKIIQSLELAPVERQ